MELLKELTNVVTRNKVKRIEMIGNPTNYASHVQKLYEGIVEGSLQNDQQGVNTFYGEGEYRQIYYTRLKRQLFKRLINSLFFIDLNQPEFNDYQKAYYACHKDYAAVKILIGRSARKNAVHLAEKTLKKALKFEFTDLVLSLSRDLRMHCGTISGNQKKYLKYKKLVKIHQEILQAELIAEELYTDLSINFVNSRATKVEIEALAKDYESELLELTQKYQSYTVNYFAFLAISLRYQISNDHLNTIKVCKRAIQFFETKPHIASKNAMVNFLFKMLGCYIQLKKHAQGEEVAERCLALLPKGKYNWFNILNHLTILLFHTRQFQKAYNVYQRATQHPDYRNLHESISEHWLINEAYIEYFISIGKIEVPKEEKKKKFRLSKFLNEVPTFSKDKRGNNINILILQLLFLLQKRQYGKVIDRMESLNIYCHRYLKKDDTFRSNCFIKMLLQLPPARFNKNAAIRKAKKYSDRLKEVPLETAKQSNELEIVPYEMLWEFVLESLDNKFHYA